MIKLEFEDGRLTESALASLREHTDMIECQCPTQLIGLLKEIRAFQAYAQDCLERYPNDVKTHEWLYSSALNLDQLVCGTLVQLARLEGYLTEANVLKRPG